MNDQIREEVARAAWPQIWAEIDRNANPVACQKMRELELQRADAIISAYEKAKSK